MRFDAIVLAGGAARRLGGVDKPGAVVAGLPLLEHALAATDQAGTTVVVGPRRATSHAVRWAREQPPGGGPVAAVAAGLPFVDAPRCLVLAADLPWVAPAVPQLLVALEHHDAAVLVTDGRRNHLAACWRADVLRDAVSALPTVRDAAVRTLLVGRDVVEVDDPHGWGHDCDTPADLAAARATVLTGAAASHPSGQGGRA